MDEHTINEKLMEIRKGINVIKNVKSIQVEISMIRLNAEKERKNSHIMTGSKIKLHETLHEVANKLDKRLLLACDSFVRGFIFEDKESK